ncbi:hypothetical protein [Paenibacillus taichungensis]|uniref:hypothetical protein n=1 Tax=Paenibacillus taichungensis TaxID=484184 RepID=UPI0038CF6AFA
MGFVRNIEVEGRLSIPKEIRDRRQIYCGCEIIIKPEVGKLILSVSDSLNCIFCCDNTDLELVYFKGKIVCKQCLNIVLANATALKKIDETLDMENRNTNMIKMKK